MCSGPVKYAERGESWLLLLFPLVFLLIGRRLYRLPSFMELGSPISWVLLLLALFGLACRRVLARLEKVHDI